MIARADIPSRHNVENLMFEMSHLIRSFCETNEGTQTKEVIHALGEMLFYISVEEGIESADLDHLKSFLEYNGWHESIQNVIH